MHSIYAGRTLPDNRFKPSQREEPSMGERPTLSIVDEPGSGSHFSLSNGSGRHQGDLPRLLRRMKRAQTAKLGADVMILDFTVHDEVDENGSFFTATVDDSPNGWADSPSDQPAE